MVIGTEPCSANCIMQPKPQHLPKLTQQQPREQEAEDGRRLDGLEQRDDKHCGGQERQKVEAQRHKAVRLNDSLRAALPLLLVPAPQPRAAGWAAPCPARC